MSDQQLEPMATKSDPSGPNPTITGGRDTPLRVIETSQMDWLGAEAGVIFPEGGSDVLAG